MTRDIQALDAHLRAVVRARDIPGCAVAAWGPDGEVFARGYGRGDPDGARPIDADTVFGIASMSKSQLALALCMLECEGRLSLEDPVYRHLPAFRLAGIPSGAVTLRHLLMHTAGIPPTPLMGWSIAMHAVSRDEPWIRAMRSTAPGPVDTAGDILAYLAEMPGPMLGAPGEIMSYCNEGFALLSTVFDQAAEMPLEAFLSERVYAPLGMARTVLDDHNERARPLSGGNITQLFERGEDGRLTCDDEPSVAPPYRGCGWVKSTARDMAAYYRCLSSYGRHAGGQVLPAAAVKRMVGAGIPLSRRACYGLALNKRAVGSRVLCEHGGGLHGVSSLGGFFLGEGRGFAVLTNIGDIDVEPLLWPLYAFAMGDALDTKYYDFTPAGRPFSDPGMAVGIFSANEGDSPDITIEQNGGGLIASQGGKAFPLAWCDGTRFVSLDENGWLKLRVEPLIRNGRAWAARVGSRVYLRKDA